MMFALAASRIGPDPQPDDHIEHLWYAPGSAGDATFLSIRPAGVQRHHIRYRFREFLRHGDTAFELISQELGGGWIPEGRDAVAYVEDCVRDLYANGFGSSPDDSRNYSLDHVVRRVVDRPRAALGQLISEFATFNFGLAGLGRDF